MDKNLTKFDIAVVLGFIFALVVGVGGFFFGLQTGKEQTASKYQALFTEQENKKAEVTVSYHQQQLVSFYHTVLLPFREFQDTWFEHMKTIETGAGSTDADALLKQLKCLTLFAKARDRLQEGQNGAALLETVEQDPYVAEAASHALLAQAEFYEAIWKWNETNEPGLTGVELIAKENLTFQEWRSLPLNGKNVFLARLLKHRNYFVPVYPQDIAARIDDLDASGQVGALKLTDLALTVRTLLSAGAVRTNDYFHSRDKHYRDEKLPQLPFF
jgi:hypothetical protein